MSSEALKYLFDMMADDKINYFLHTYYIASFAEGSGFKNQILVGQMGFFGLKCYKIEMIRQ